MEKIKREQIEKFQGEGRNEDVQEKFRVEHC